MKRGVSTFLLILSFLLQPVHSQTQVTISLVDTIENNEEYAFEFTFKYDENSLAVFSTVNDYFDLYDLTNRSKPVYRESFDVELNLFHNPVVSDDYLFYVGRYSNFTQSLQVYDKQTKSLIAETSEIVGGWQHFLLQGNYLYGAYGDYIEVVDVSDETNPVSSDLFEEEYDGIDPEIAGIVDGTMYVVQETSEYYRMLAYDVSDPSDLSLTYQTIFYNDESLNSKCVATIQTPTNAYLIVALDGEAVVHDITQPTNMSIVTTYTTDNIWPESCIQVSYPYVYTSSSGYGVTVFDIELMRTVARLNTDDTYRIALFAGEEISYVYSVGGDPYGDLKSFEITHIPPSTSNEDSNEDDSPLYFWAFAVSVLILSILYRKTSKAITQTKKS